MSTDTYVLASELPVLSATALSNYDNCMRQGQYYQDRAIPRTVDQGQAMGRAWHKGLEILALARKQTGDAWLAKVGMIELQHRILAVMSGMYDEVRRDPTYVVKPDDMPDHEVHTKLAHMLAEWTTDQANMWVDRSLHTTVLDVEVRVEADFGSPWHRFVGYIDSVYEVGVYGTIGVDWKSTGRIWGGAQAQGDLRKTVQAPLYAEAYYLQTGRNMDWFTYDIMTKAKTPKFQRVWVQVDAFSRRPFIERWLSMSRIVAALEGLGVDMPTNPGSNLCSEKYCSYWSICEMGEALNKPGGTP